MRALEQSSHTSFPLRAHPCQRPAATSDGQKPQRFVRGTHQCLQLYFMRKMPKARLQTLHDVAAVFIWYSGASTNEDRLRSRPLPAALRC
jgi:hypothetical protein